MPNISDPTRRSQTTTDLLLQFSDEEILDLLEIARIAIENKLVTADDELDITDDGFNRLANKFDKFMEG